MTAPSGKYRYILVQAGLSTTYQLEFVSGTDVYNAAKRPLRYVADDDIPWNCDCEAKLALKTADSLVSNKGVNCTACASPFATTQYACCHNCLQLFFPQLAATCTVEGTGDGPGFDPYPVGTVQTSGPDAITKSTSYLSIPTGSPPPPYGCCGTGFVDPYVSWGVSFRPYVPDFASLTILWGRRGPFSSEWIWYVFLVYECGNYKCSGGIFSLSDLQYVYLGQSPCERSQLATWPRQSPPGAGSIVGNTVQFGTWTLNTAPPAQIQVSGASCT